MDDDVFFDTLDAGALVVVGVVVVMSAVDRVQDLVGSAVETVTERMVLAVFVVISHVPLGFAAGVDSGLAYTDLLVELYGLTLRVALCWVVTRLSALLLPLAGLPVVLLSEGSRASAEVSLVDVKTTIVVDLCGRGMTGVVFAVLDVELGVGVSLVRLTVAKAELSVSTCYDVVPG